jgi:hypothetical protein
MKAAHVGSTLTGLRRTYVADLGNVGVDACRSAALTRPAGWKPRITVTEDDDGATVTVDDNGIGMDEHIVRSFFSKVGFSYYRSSEFEGGFRPISEFGIGFLSCFMLADSIEVESKMDGKDSIKLDIRSLTDSFIPSYGQRKHSGTEIRMHLKTEELPGIDVLDRVKHFVRRPSIPIIVMTKEGTKHVLHGRRVRASDFEENQEIGQDSSTASANQSNIEVDVTIKPDRAGYPLWSHQGTRNRTVQLLQEGFFVGELSDQLPELSNMLCTINLTGDRAIDLTADRTRMATRAEEVWGDIANTSATAIKMLFDLTVSEDRPASWWRFVSAHFDRDALSHGPSIVPPYTDRMALCTYSKIDGFRPRTIQDINSWTGDIYRIGREDHNDIRLIGPNIVDEHLVVVSPSLQLSDFESWFTDRIKAKDYNSLEKASTIEYYSMIINRTRRTFIDAGRRLGKWRIKTSLGADRAHRYGSSRTFFDYQHPLTQIIVKYTGQEIPRRSEIILANTFRSSGQLKPDNMKKKLVETSQALLEDGVIIDTSLHHAVVAAEERETPSHSCPYGTIPEHW